MKKRVGKMAYQNVKGMRDFLPAQAKKKQFIEDLCRAIFEKYGYEPLQTPVVEDFALLAAKGSGGEAIKGEIYYFKDKGEREIGLRYDLTVPLGRVAASNPMLQKPFRRYCISTVYRYDRPQAKRYREFTQADADIVGAKGILADFESLQVSVDVMRSLGLQFTVRTSSRQLLEELALKCNVQPSQIADALRSIDKLDKIGEKEVEKEFEAKGIDCSLLEKISTNSLEQVKDTLGESQGVSDIETLLALCRENGLNEVRFDLSLCRGLEYYTGTVFEIALNEGPSVGGGGRYDNLISLYGGQPTPAVGIIAPLSNDAWPAAFKIGAELRKAGVAVEMEVMERNIKKNLEYAQKRAIGFIAFIGEQEVKAKAFKVKDMQGRSEKEFAFNDIKEVFSFIKGHH